MRLPSAIVLASLFPTQILAQDQSLCSAVYQNAVRNFSLEQQTQSSLSYYYNLHCEQNGDVRNFSFDGSAGFTIKAIPFNFTSSLKNDTARMQEFCKAGFEQNGFASASTSISDIVMTDALNSFNQCRALESNGIVITHQEAEPFSVTIIGRPTSTGLDARLESITYDPDDMNCTSNSFSEDLSQITLDGTQGYEIDRDFVITCVRNGVQEDGQEFFKRTTLQLSTNFGPYTVVLDPNSALGFGLSNQAKAMYEAAIAERNSLSNQLGSANERISNLSNRLAAPQISIHTFGTGEYDQTFFSPRYDPRWGPSPEQRADELCGGAHHKLFVVSDRPGGCCGYTDYVVACVAN